MPFVSLVRGARDAPRLAGAMVVASAARPTGECQVTTDPLNFPDAVLGPGVSPALATSVRTATIRNDGGDCLTINNIGNSGPYAVVTSNPASPALSEFVWAAFSGAVLPGASAPAILVTFTPPAEGPFTRTLTFTSDIPSSPHTVTFSGDGWIARSRIVPTVRVIRVQNTGNGPLTFRARTAGNALFGIQRLGDSITSPLTEATFTVNPSSLCGPGPTGTGEVLFAVTFFANAVPGLQTGQLILDNHNGQFGAPATFTFDLEAEVIAAINADVELVLDRSGSMNDSSGPRRKIDTALDAARLFVQLCRPNVDDRVATSRFNTVPEQVQTITAITSVNQASLVSAIVEASFSPTGGTAIAGGEIQAVNHMNANPRSVAPPALNKAIVVLTDANDNTPFTNPADNQQYTLLGENGTLPVGVPADVKLYGVGIGDDVDTGRLAQLCPATGGHFLHVHDFSGLDFFKLEKHFTQIYMATVDLAQISDPTFFIQPNDTHEHAFHVLRGDVTIMVVIFDRDGVRLPFWLRSPQGEIIELTTVPPSFQIRPGMTNTARFYKKCSCRRASRIGMRASGTLSSGTMASSASRRASRQPPPGRRDRRAAHRRGCRRRMCR